jgi:hypothetical protein
VEKKSHVPQEPREKEKSIARFSVAVLARETLHRGGTDWKNQLVGVATRESTEMRSGESTVATPWTRAPSDEGGWPGIPVLIDEPDDDFGPAVCSNQYVRNQPESGEI